MQANNIIDSLDNSTLERLKFEAESQGKDIEATAIWLIKKGLGMEKIPNEEYVYKDLQHLAGTWAEEDYIDFKKNTADFEDIDEELWK